MGPNRLLVSVAYVALLALLILTTPSGRARAAESDKPTLFIVGDSTVRNSTKGQQGWGERVSEHFDLTRINVVNKAIGGRSSRTFITEGRWDEVLKSAKPGDFVLIQFGHNDGIAPDDERRPRGTLRGVGDETREIIHPHTKRPEVVYTYGWYLREYVKDARDKGMTPILCSPIPRLPKETVSEPLPAPTSYPLWAEEVARAEKVPFIDLHRLILARYAAVAPAELKREHFCEADNTHTSPAGAAFNAGVVADAIGKLEGCALAKYLAK